MSKRRISRRHLLRGIGNVAIALPLLEAMGEATGLRALGGREAYGQSAFPKRFITVFTGSGTILDKWRPTGTATDFTFGPMLAALNAHKDKIVVLDGLYGNGANGEGHTDHMGSVLTGMPLLPAPGGTGYADGISIDQVIAQDIGKDTQLKSLELCAGPVTRTVWARLAYSGSNQPIPPEGDPQKVFTRLFGGAGPTTAPNAAQILREQRRTVLDAIQEDYGALSRRIGTADRRRVDQHLESIRDIEKRLDVVGGTGAACSATQPASTTDFPTVGKLQIDLLVMALACDRTRVATFLWEEAADNRHTFTWIGVNDQHHTGIHNGHLENVEKMLTWFSEQHAYLLEKMKGVPEGSGTLLDNSLVFFASEQSNGATHGTSNMPYLLAGNAGGVLKTGRWLRFTGNPPHSNLLVSILNMMGNPATTFGKKEWCTGPVPGLV